MKKIFFIFLSIFIHSSLLGYSVAETPFQILYLPFGARASAMGGAFCALADDATGLWVNPAGLGKILRSQCFLTHQEWFLDFRDSYVGVCLPSIYRKGMVGGSLLYSTAGNIEGYTGENIRTKDFKTAETVLLLGYGNKIRKNLFAGISMSFLHHNLAPGIGGLYGDKGMAVGFNLGLLYEWNKKYSIGCAIQNIGTQVFYYYGGRGILPRNIKIGGKFTPRENLNLVIDVSLPQFDIPYLQAGSEYWVHKEYFCIRAGITKELVGLKHKSESFPLTFGFGAKYRDFLLDYAFAGYGTLGTAHRITFNWIFGPPPMVAVGSVLIQVVDAEDYTPIGNAIVEIGGMISDTAITSMEGTVSWENIPTGEYWIKIEKEFYETEVDTFVIFLEETTKKLYPLIRKKK